MSGLIKHATACDVAMPLQRSAAVPTINPGPPVVDPHIAALEVEIARLETALADERHGAAEAVAAARREGRGDAIADDDARTLAVTTALADALAAWNTRLAELDDLALALTRIALAKVFGDDDARIDNVAQTIAHHCARVGAQAVIGVRVSPEDFAHDQLAARFDDARGPVAIDGTLKSGEARIDLRLGAIDVDPTVQWAVLDRALAMLERQA